MHSKFSPMHSTYPRVLWQSVPQSFPSLAPKWYLSVAVPLSCNFYWLTSTSSNSLGCLAAMIRLSTEVPKYSYKSPLRSDKEPINLSGWPLAATSRNSVDNGCKSFDPAWSSSTAVIMKFGLDLPVDAQFPVWSLLHRQSTCLLCWCESFCFMTTS